MQLCELYAYDKGVHLFKDFVKNIDEFKRTLTDSTMIKFIKSGLNKSYGYFMLRNRQDKHKLCATLSEFQDLIDNNNVLDFDAINDNYVDVCFESKSSLGTNCYSNLTIGIHILAYSRMIMDRKITMLKENFKSMKVFLINIDAIAFSLHVNDDISLLQLDEDKIGAFKPEIKDASEILSFQALSPHSFNISYLTKSGDFKNISKVCGFSLQNAMNAESLDQEVFKCFISEALDGREISKSTTQVRHFSSNDFDTVEKKILKYQLKNILFKKRVIKKENFSTFPFGYTQNM